MPFGFVGKIGGEDPVRGASRARHMVMLLLVLSRHLLALNPAWSKACPEPYVVQGYSSSLITSGAFIASITRDAGRPFSNSVAMARRYLRMWRKNFLYPAQRY